MSTRKSSMMARRTSKAAEAPAAPTRTRSGVGKASHGEPAARQLTIPLPPGPAAPSTISPGPAAPMRAATSPVVAAAPRTDPRHSMGAPPAPMPAASASPTPREPAIGNIARHLGELRAALADGWEIVQPIFARPLWSAPDDSATAFNFVLRRSQGTRLITVPGGRTVERFIRDRNLTVDHAR